MIIIKFLHAAVHLTCELAAMDSTHWLEVAFQNLMVLSVVPPPVARRLLCQGHHARACRTGSTGSDTMQPAQAYIMAMQK